ncbi:MAG: HD domain-containing protein, partial [Deltaproteobacteria bacterium]
MTTPPYPLTDRFAEAFAFAHARHAARQHYRKGTSIPYVAHLMGVSALVLQHGGDETEAIAGLLHDVVEDTPTSLAEVRERFGEGVAAIVDICTDAQDAAEKPPWRPRKERYIARIRTAPLAARRVIAADKLHNAQAIVRDHETHGDALWARFTAPPGETAWYYGAVRDTLVDPGDLPSPLVRL